MIITLYREEAWRWAGIALVNEIGQMVVYQIARPEGYISAKYHYDTDRGLWATLAAPRLEYTTLEIHLSGEAKPWDGRPPRLEITDAPQNPLRLDP